MVATKGTSMCPMETGILNKDQLKIMQETENKLNTLFTEKNMPVSHGVGHCKTVLAHMYSALQASKLDITEEKKLLLALAALLHEADDHKYFKPNSKNASNIMSEVLVDVADKEKIISDVEEMISYVSASVNGNSVPEKAKSDPTLLWPRFCDRLESIGAIGAVRCAQYNVEVKAPLSTESTPRPQTESELWKNVTEERWQKYQKDGDSASMMDHYYDKLLQIASFPPEVVQNSYLVEEASKRVEPLVKICLEFGKTGVAPMDMIMGYA